MIRRIKYLSFLGGIFGQSVIANHTFPNSMPWEDETFIEMWNARDDVPDWSEEIQYTYWESEELH